MDVLIISLTTKIFLHTSHQRLKHIMYRPTNHRPQRSTQTRGQNLPYTLAEYWSLWALAFFTVSFTLASVYASQPYEECIREATTARQQTECAIIYLGR